MELARREFGLRTIRSRSLNWFLSNVTYHHCDLILLHSRLLPPEVSGHRNRSFRWFPLFLLAEKHGQLTDRLKKVIILRVLGGAHLMSIRTSASRMIGLTGRSNSKLERNLPLETDQIS